MRRLLPLALLLLVPALPAADIDKGKLAAIPSRMQKFVDDGTVAGIVTVVGSSKGVASLDAVGRLRAEADAPMPKDALFRIASMTKPITAAAVMILVDEGKVAIADPVEKHLPEFKGQMLVAARNKEKDVLVLMKPSRPITVRDLLTHTSGLPFYPGEMANLYVKRNRTLTESILAVSQSPLEFEPGTRWAYCNSGIDALGRIVEVVSGQSYEQFLRSRIFDPLGMADTTFAPTKDQLGRLAGLYESKDGKLVRAPDRLIGPGVDSRHPIPAGGLYSTGTDVAKFYQMMLAGGTLDGKKVLSPESVKTMTAVHTGDLKAGFTEGTGFGLGVAVVRKPEGVTAMLSPGTYGHGGAFGTQSWADPRRDLFVVLLIQRVGLKNADASEMRREFQTRAIEAFAP